MPNIKQQLSNRELWKSISSVTLKWNVPPIPESPNEQFKKWLLHDVMHGIQTLSIRQERLMAAIDDLQAAVAKETTVIASASKLMTDLSSLIKAAGTDQVKLSAITADLDANNAALAKAVTDNTPSPSLP